MDETQTYLQYEALIYKIAKRFYGVELEDLFQAGVLGILKAYKNYRKEGNAKFSSYAYDYIYEYDNDYEYYYDDYYYDYDDYDDNDDYEDYYDNKYDYGDNNLPKKHYKEKSYYNDADEVNDVINEDDMGYYKQNNIYYSCIPNCDICSDSKYCFNCSVGYDYINNKCIEQYKDCDSYTNSGENIDKSTCESIQLNNKLYKCTFISGTPISCGVLIVYTFPSSPKSSYTLSTTTAPPGTVRVPLFVRLSNKLP